jgi:putative MATE family efflux protein
MLMQQMANASMGGATAAAVARALGAGRRDDAAALVAHSLLIACGMAAIFTAVFVVAGPAAYALMGGSGATLAAAVEYSNAIFAGAAAYWILSALTSVVRGAGQPTVLAVTYVAAEALHIGLVPVLVFGLGPIPPLGITGAALATVTCVAAAAAALAWYIASGRTVLSLSRRSLRLERRFFGEILRVGGPMSLQPVLNNLTLATLTSFVATLGPAALAGFGAAVRLEYVLYPLTFGLGAGVLALVGTNVGAAQFARAARVAWTAATLAASITAVIGLVALVWPSAWIEVFSPDPAVHLTATSYLCIAALAYPFLGLGLTLASAFQAAGRPFWPLLAIAGRVVVVAAGGWLVIHLTESGLAGLGVVAASGLLVYGLTLTLAFRAGAWRIVRPRGDVGADLPPRRLERRVRAPQEPHGDREIQEVPQDAVEEGDLVGAGEVEDHAGDPAAKRHAEHRGHQHGAHAHPGLFGREELADDDGIRGHDAALDQAEQRRQGVQRGESVEGQEEEQGQRLQTRA